MGAEHKYTDRDVRESAELVEAAIEFLESYQGDFEFLIDCKMRLSAGGELSVGMVRGVLNCMRANPRVKNLPEPLHVSDEDAEVIPMKQRQTYPSKRGAAPCYETGPHEMHNTEQGEYARSGYCSGIYLINREWSIRA